MCIEDVDILKYCSTKSLALVKISKFLLCVSPSSVDSVVIGNSPKMVVFLVSNCRIQSSDDADLEGEECRVW